MKTFKTISLTLILVLFLLVVKAQPVNYYGAQADNICKGSTTVSYNEASKSPSCVTFSNESARSTSQVMDLLSSVLHFGIDDQLVKYQEEKDKLGFTHYRYQQYYKAIKVENGQYLVHEKEGRIRSINGLWIDHITSTTVPGISAQTAIRAALTDCNANRYKWEMPEEEARIKQLNKNANETYYPNPELVLVAKNFDYNARELHLCYKFDVYADSPMSRTWYYVDAFTGAIIAKENRICTTHVNATGNTFYNGIKPMVTDSFATNTYRLREYTRGLGIESYDLNTGTNYGTAVDFTNNSTVWNVPTNYDRAAYDAHWGAESTYDYYLNVHGRNSLDNAGMKLISYLHYGVNYNDAFWNGTAVTYGDGNHLAGGCNAFPSIDVCGHEFTHGLTRHTAALLYINESGALNESFSDIFGANVEFYTTPGQADWLVAEDIMVTTGTAIRSMSNPNLYSHPDTYLGTNWYTGLSDAGGVHKNSGVQNFWYYLLSQGGSGLNDIGNNYSVTGIGRVKAEQIAYRNLTVYMTSFANYHDSRRNSIQAAQDIYGPCSAEVIATTNAWYAVGIGPAYSSAITANFSVSGNYSCSVPFTVNFTNISVNATNVLWNFGDNTTSTTYHPSHTYTVPGTYSIKLVCSSSCGASDSIILSSLITISSPTAPTVLGDVACEPSALNLSANGNGTLQWFTNPFGGNSIYTGNNYTTPILASSTTYYVESQLAGNTGTCGKVDSAGGSNGPWGGYYEANMIFDVLQACTLKTVKVYATSAATRNITLRSATGTLLQDYSVTLPVGESTLSLNFPLNPGTGYRLGGDTLFFSMNIGNVTFPYNLNGVASITGSSVTTSTTPIYLFFYNWQFETAPCISLRTPVTGIISTAPPATITSNGSTTICQGGSVTLTTNASSTYLWSNGATTQSILVSTAGNYAVTVTNENGCSALSSATAVTVNIPPATPGAITGTKNGVCINTSKNYTVPLVNNVFYSWTPPPGSSITQGQGSNSVTVSFGGSFSSGNLSVLAYNNCGPGPSKKLKINSVPVTPGTITGASNSNCSSSSVYSIRKISGATTYTWSTNIVGAVITTNPSPGDTAMSISFPIFVTGTINVTANNACGSSIIKSLTVKGTTATPGTIFGNSAPCSGTTQVYFVTPVAGATSYQWTVPAGSSKLSGATTNSLTVLIGNAGGNITVKAKNACGSSYAKTLPITVPCRINGNDVADELTWRIYPNPANDKIHFQFLSPGEIYNLELFDAIGKQIVLNLDLQISATENNMFDISFLNSGVYLLKITNQANGEFLYGKFVKK